MNTADVLLRLSETDGPSGFEDRVAKEITKLLAPLTDEVARDVMGNVIGVRRCGRPNARRLLLDAHIDEIGFIVTGYDNGFVRFSVIGGVDARMLPARAIRFLTEPPVRGVIMTLPPHILEEADSDKPFAMDALFVDVGMTDEEVRAALPRGTAAVYDAGAVRLNENVICGKALDDRSCFAVILDALERLRGEDLPVDVYVMASTQEEVGVRGATAGAFAVDPDYAVILDVGHGKTPDASGTGLLEFGGGCGVAVGPNMNRKYTDRILRAAEEKGIPHQIEVIPTGSSGTNARAVQISREGVATALLSLPLKYMHSPSEMVHLADMDACARLLCEAVRAAGEVD